MRLRALANGRGIWALADQALLSAGNFLTNILIIRHLSPDRFGNYAVLFSVVLFLNNLHASLVTYPLSVSAGSDDAEQFRSRVRSALILTALLAIPLGGALATVAFCIGGGALAMAVLAAMVLWQAQETLRRSLMARPAARPRHRGRCCQLPRPGRRPAAAGAVGQRHAADCVCDNRPPPACWPRWCRRRSCSCSPALRSATGGCSRRSNPGRWGGGCSSPSLVGLITVYATPWILRYCHGSKEVAAYQALSNLLGVSNPIITSMAGLIVPAVAQARSRSGIAAARHAAVQYGRQGAALLLPYYALLLLAPTFALRLFYGKNSPYLAFTTPLRLFVVIYSLYYLAQVVFGLMNGLGRSRWSFYAQSCAAIANAAICLPLAAVVGLVGSVWGGLIPMALQLAVALLLVKRLLPRPAVKPSFSASDDLFQPLVVGST